jgi:hypothetical protein
MMLTFGGKSWQSIGRSGPKGLRPNRRKNEFELSVWKWERLRRVLRPDHLGV